MSISREWTSIFFGVAAAGFGPLVGGTFFYLVRGQFDEMRQSFVFALLAYPFACAFSCIFGLPLFFLARRFNLVSWWSAVCCGLLVGCAVHFVVLSGTPDINNLLLYAAEGIASASLFFAVCKRGTDA